MSDPPDKKMEDEEDKAAEAKDLFRLADCGGIETIKKFENPDLMVKDEIGDTLLHRTIKTSQDDLHTDLAVYLLSQAPDLAYAQNNYGETPLCVACRNVVMGIHITNALVEAYPTSALSIPDKNGETPLHHLVGPLLYEEQIHAEEWVNLARILRQLERVVMTLIKRGADIDAENCDHFTPLLSTLFGRYETYVYYDKMIEILVENGAKLRSSDGKHAISYVKSTRVARMILERDNSEINIPDSYGRTPLYYVLVNINYDLREILELMFKHGAIIQDGTDIVLLARELGYPFSIIEVLLHNLPDYDINTPDESGGSLLIQYGCDTEIVEKLLVMGADVTLKDNEGRTAWTNSWKIEEPRGIVKLIDAGADPTEGNILGVIWHRYCDKTDKSPDKEKWYHLFKYLLNLPQFQSMPTLAEYLVDIIKRKIFSYRNYEQRAYMKILKYMVKRNPIVYSHLTTDKIPTVAGHCFNNAPLDPISLVLVHSDYLPLHHDEAPNTKHMFPLEEFIQNMFDVGFTVSECPKECVTPLTALLTITHCPEYFEDVIIKLAREFIIRGVNIESQVLQISNIESSNYFTVQDLKHVKATCNIPDALLLAYLYNRREIVEMLLPHYWAPAMSMLCFKPHHNSIVNVAAWFKFLCTYERIPHGTLFARHVRNIMRTMSQHFINHADLLSPEDLEEVREVLEKYQELTSSPPKLTELARYAVRQSFASKATLPSTSLIDLLRDSVEPTLHFLLFDSEYSSYSTEASEDY